MTTRKNKTINFQQFFEACDVLRKNKEIFKTAQLNLADTAVELQKMMPQGFPEISSSTIAKIKKALKIEWSVSPKRNKPGTPFHTTHALSTICRAVEKLYQHQDPAGVEIPMSEAFVKLLEYLRSINA